MTPAQVKELIEALREIGWNDKADQLERVLNKNKGSVQEGNIPLAGTIKFRLEKFDGDYEPGKEPVEVIEGEEKL